MRVAVLGAGAWGTALASQAADEGHDTSIWDRDPVALARIRAGGTVQTFDDAVAAVAQRAIVVMVVPSEAIREAATRIAPALAPGAVLVCAAKGLEAGTRYTLDRVIHEAAPAAPVVLLSGPSFAREIAAGLPAAVVAASRDAAAADTVQKTLATDRFRIYTSDDVVGVALGGALKNVIAIAAGCSDGLGFGNNARAALITRGLHEIGRMATRMGGDPLTLSGLAGLGDLVLTCTGELSRNRQVGLALAAGEPLAAITTRLGQVAEGVGTAHIADELARELGVDTPIISQVAAVLAGRRSPRQAVADLLARHQGSERA